MAHKFLLGYTVNKIRTTVWTAFYYLVAPLVFEALGRRCQFEGWIDIPQKGGLICVGNGVHVCRNVSLTCTEGAVLEVLDDSFIGPGVVVSVHGRVQIGRDVLIAEYTCIHDNDHVFADPSLPITRQGFSVGTVVVGDGCWIGSGAKLLKNSRLGARSILGAGAVLTKSIPEGVVAAGVPARVVKMRQASRSPTLGTAP